MTKDRRKICFVTGNRADYGLLRWPMEEVRSDPDLWLMVVATGAHLSSEYGLTARTIEEDGFPIDAEVEMLLASDTSVGIAKSIGLGVIGFADAFERLKPDIIVLLGDRYETLAAASAALVARRPLAHIAGGDVTEGAFDEAIRHAATKMAHIHFVTNEAARRRVLQLGEDPARVHLVGSPGLDALRRLDLLDRAALERELSFALGDRSLLVTYHPETLADVPAAAQADELLAALSGLPEEVAIVFTGANADTGGRAIAARTAAFAASRPRTAVFESLGTRRYLSLLAQVTAVVGNSSSALYEAPSLRKPAVNVGDRQKGRLRAASVIDCPCRGADIRAAIERAFALDCSAVVNPYGDGASAPRIKAVLKSLPDPRSLVRKTFHDLP